MGIVERATCVSPIGLRSRSHSLLNEGVAHGVPGSSFSNVFEKGDYDPTKHAIVTFSTLKKVIRKWIADVYHQKPHRALGIAPAQMWNSSIRPEDIRVPDDPALLDVTMGRRFARVLTHKGIEFQGLFYNSPELHEMRSREGSVLQVEIFVFSPSKKEVFKVPALRSDYATGIGLFQHRVIRHYQKRHSGLESSPDGWLRVKQEIAEIIENGDPSSIPSLELLTKPVSAQTEKISQALFELRVLRLGFYEDGDVGIGVFPQIEKVLIGG